MFIVVGNNQEEQKVLVYDTEDSTINKVSYNFFKKALNLGVSVAGVNTTGEILCKESNVLKELSEQIRKTLEDAVEHNVANEYLRDYLFSIVGPYGLAQDAENIYATLNSNHVVFPLLNRSIEIGQGGTIVHKLRTVKLPEANLDRDIMILLNELVKVPLPLTTDIIDSIYTCTTSEDELYYMVVIDDTQIAVAIKECQGKEREILNRIISEYYDPEDFNEDFSYEDALEEAAEIAKKRYGDISDRFYEKSLATNPYLFDYYSTKLNTNWSYAISSLSLKSVDKDELDYMFVKRYERT